MCNILNIITFCIISSTIVLPVNGNKYTLFIPKFLLKNTSARLFLEFL